MAGFLERRIRREPQQSDEAGVSQPPRARAGQWSEVQFVPARWLVLALSILGALLGRGRVGKVGIATLVWSFAPRSLKVAVTGFALVSAIVFFGAIAAIALLALQLT